jgi:hypothetical protein
MSNDIEKQHNESVVWKIPIEKVEDKRIIEGVVLTPDTVDAHGDIIKSEVIEETSADFLSKYNSFTKLGVQHSVFDKKFQLRQSYIAKTDMDLGNRKIKKGSWVIEVKVLDDDIWDKIKKGEITGFSIGGRAIARKLTEE